MLNVVIQSVHMNFVFGFLDLQALVNKNVKFHDLNCAHVAFNFLKTLGFMEFNHGWHCSNGI